METKPWISKHEIGDAQIVLDVLKANNGTMISGDLFKTLNGVEKKMLLGHLTKLKRMGLLRFSDWYPYVDTFRITLIEKTDVKRS